MGILEINSGYQAWQQAPFSTDHLISPQSYSYRNGYLRDSGKNNTFFPLKESKLSKLKLLIKGLVHLFAILKSHEEKEMEIGRDMDGDSGLTFPELRIPFLSLKGYGKV